MFRSFMRALVLAPLYLLVTASLALAQEEAGGVDVTPLFDYAVEAVVLVVVSLVALFAQRILKVNLGDSMRETISEIAYRGANLARVKLAGDDGKITVEIKPDILRLGADYLVKSAPDALAYFKIDPTTAEGQKKIRGLIESRLPAESEPEPV